MVLGLTAFVLLWAAGLLALSVLRDGGQELAERWSRKLQGDWAILLSADETGCLVYCPEAERDKLLRYSADGELCWSRRMMLDPYRGPFQRIGDISYVTSAAGELTALTDAGEELWSCQPDFTRYRELLEPLPDAKPVVFLKAGILLYGVDADGRPCWVANTQQAYEHYGLPSYFSYDGQYSFLCGDFFNKKVFTIGGEQRQLKEPKHANEQQIVAGRPVFMGGQPMQLCTILPDGGLLYSADNRLVLLRDGKEFSRVLDKGLSQQGITFSSGQFAASPELLLHPTSDGVLHAMDREMNEVWSYSLEDCNLAEAHYSGDAFVLLTTASDNLLRSLEFLSLMYPRLNSILPFLSPAAGQLLPQLSGSEKTELLVIRDGRKIAEMDIGGKQRFNRYSSIRCAGGLIYQLSADGQLRCLATGGGDA
ncbi:MAG: hypothetical protein R3F46_15130 [bacterium]